jgi:hypothetical protein
LEKKKKKLEKQETWKKKKIVKIRKLEKEENCKKKKVGFGQAFIPLLIGVAAAKMTAEKVSLVSRKRNFDVAFLSGEADRDRRKAELSDHLKDPTTLGK